MSLTEDLRGIYQHLELIVDRTERGAYRDELEAAGSDQQVTVDEGTRALKAIDEFAQQFDIEVDA